MSWENLPILIILVLAVIGHNQSVALAAAVLLIVKLLGCDAWFGLIETKGLTLGITILTIAILAPVAAGRITMHDIITASTTPTGMLAIVAGIFAAWAAGRGLFFIKASPEMISSLVLGTVVGVCFLRGIAIGPLIAAGMVSLVLALFQA